MVLFRVDEAARFASGLRERGLLVGAVGPAELRAVTHLDVDSGDVEAALAVVGEAVA